MILITRGNWKEQKYRSRNKGKKQGVPGVQETGDEKGAEEYKARKRSRILFSKH